MTMEATENNEDSRRPDPNSNGLRLFKAPTFNIEQLPFEILAHIFQLYVIEDKQERTASSVRPNGAFPLGSVCRTWRRVAWTSQHLWSSLSFWMRKETTENQIQLAIEWLGRACQHPLEISLQGYIEEDLSLDSRSQQNFVAILSPLIDAIGRSLDRCNRLELLNLPSSTYARLTLSGKPPVALQYLTLRCADPIARLDLALAAPVFLQLEGIPMDCLSIDYANLTEFSVSEIPINQVQQVLAGAPRLVKCYLMDIDDTDDEEWERKSVVCREMTELRACPMYYHNDVVADLLRSITCPSLRVFSVVDHVSLNLHTLIGFLLRSSCPLTHLTIGEENTTCEDLVRIATALPSLTFLSLTKYEEAAVALRSSSSVNSFCHTLCLDERYHTVSDVDSVNQKNSMPVMLPGLRHLLIETRSLFSWEYLPGLRSRYCYEANGTRLREEMGRSALESISIIYEHPDRGYDGRDSDIHHKIHVDESDSEKYLIQNWDTFSQLVKLSGEIRLDLQVERGFWREHLFALSYTALKRTSGRPPEDVKQFMCSRTWAPQRLT
ncbi:hypothetical protein JR316_0000143 [Psilocybe cubensis]|uniref:Uncharacterized protein n=2 Tax=Psilocybe cubensis TaxID=181762 RepID=A0ACB8HFY4_PSICU|nr:hypothetical protein JR316_0000143 [Psilocybe cubensis]KAH9486079.1 hypothetical protein JR316_0000143 [Psilocybe cubensis]